MAKRKRRRKKKPPKRTYQEKRFDKFQRHFIVQDKMLKSTNKILPYFIPDAHIDSVTQLEPLRVSLRKKIFRISFVYEDIVYGIVHAEEEGGQHDLYKCGEIVVKNFEQIKDEYAKDVFKSAEFIKEVEANEEEAFDIVRLNEKVYNRLPKEFRLFLIEKREDAPEVEDMVFTYKEFKRIAPENLSGKMRDEFYNIFTPGDSLLQDVRNTLEPPPDDWSFRVRVINMTDRPELIEAFDKFQTDFTRYREKVILNKTGYA